MPTLVPLRAARVHLSHLSLRLWQSFFTLTSRARSRSGDRGQTTAEYGLVILAAGTLALAAILWARSSGSITNLFQSVIDQLTGNVGG